MALYAERAGLTGTIGPASFVDTFLKQDELLAEFDSPNIPMLPPRDYWSFDLKEDLNAVFLMRYHLQQRDERPLSDIMLGVTDNIAVAGVPVMCGSLSFRTVHPETDANIVQRLLNKGIRILGKPNMDEFALGGSERSMQFRLAQNPAKHGFQPGGSSAGSGVAVVEETIDAALGSDTGSSMRFPALFCGVVGSKPTRALIRIPESLRESFLPLGAKALK